MAALYGRLDAWEGLDGPNHYFFDRNDVPHKFELGSLNYEGCAGIVALGDYLRRLAGLDVYKRQSSELAKSLHRAVSREARTGSLPRASATAWK